MIPEGNPTAAPTKAARAPRSKNSGRVEEKEARPEYRFGIGEWYGKSFIHLNGDERRAYAELQLRPKEERPKQPCPFLSRPTRPADCHKAGGICSLRSYQRDPNGKVSPDVRRSTLVTICPSRFAEEGPIYPWINDVILPGRSTVALGETPFLHRAPKVGQDKASQRKAGRIDDILVVPDSNPLEWIPIEKQAVYFSGKKMLLDFLAISQTKDDSIPFPVIRRRPDYRSSSAKRLLPQLEIKVKELRNWAKKTAVVVDEDFFAEFGPMQEEGHISTAHLVWFVVKYELKGDRYVTARGFSRMVKLENSIEAVIAAQPIPEPEFERTLQTKLQAKLNAGKP